MVKNVYRNARRLSACIFVAAFSLLGATLLFPKSTHATTLPVVHESGALSSNTTWSAGSVYMIDNTVTITSGITLIIDAGAIVKVGSSTYGVSVQNGGTLDVNGTALNATVFTSYADDSYGGDSNADGASTGSYGFTILSSGVVNSNGTAADPVTFTSYKDDTIGGDTNSDGSSSSPATKDTLMAFDLGNGSANIAHTNFKYAGTAIAGEANVLNISDSDLSNVGTGISLTGPGTSGPLYANIVRTHFAPTNAQALDLAGVPDLSLIPFSGSNKNTVTGSGVTATVQFRDSTIPTSSSWEISGASGAILKADGVITVNGDLHIDSGVTFVQSGGYSWTPATQVSATGSVEIDHGAVLKNYHTQGISLAAGATLDVNGTSTDPVTLTSLKDDSVGGDTNGDGSTTGSAGDFGAGFQLNGNATANFIYFNEHYGGNPIYSTGGDITISHATFTNGSNGLYIDGGTVNATDTTLDTFTDGMDVINGYVTFRGSLLNMSAKGIHACNWASLCYVDAYYVNWGSDAGPYLTGPGGTNLVCGQAFVDPFTTSSGPSSGSGMFLDGNCDSNPTPADLLPGKQANFQSMLDGLNELCADQNQQDACDTANRRIACQQSAYNTLKNHADVSFGEFPNYSNSTAALNTIMGNVRSKMIDEATTTGTSAILGAINESLGIVHDLGDTFDSCISS